MYVTYIMLAAQMDRILEELNEIADTRLVGSRAIGLELDDSDIDVIMISDDPEYVRDVVIDRYNPIIDRDDRIIRLIADIDGYQVDIFVLRPDHRMVTDRLNHVRRYSNMLTRRDIATIMELKEWAIDHHVYDSGIGYLGGVISLELYYSMRPRDRTIHGFLSFYGNMPYHRFSRMANDWRRRGVLSFMNKYTWNTITAEMRSPEPLPLIPQWVTTDPIRDSLKYLPSYFGDVDVIGYRVYDDDGIIHIMFNARGPTDEIIDRFAQSFQRYGMDVTITDV